MMVDCGENHISPVVPTHSSPSRAGISRFPISMTKPRIAALGHRLRGRRPQVEKMLQRSVDRKQVKRFRQYRLEQFGRVDKERMSMDWLNELNRYEEAYEQNRQNRELWRLDDDGNYPEVSE